MSRFMSFVPLSSKTVEGKVIYEFLMTRIGDGEAYLARRHQS